MRKQYNIDSDTKKVLDRLQQRKRREGLSIVLLLILLIAFGFIYHFYLSSKATTTDHQTSECRVNENQRECDDRLDQEDLQENEGPSDLGP